MSKKPAPKKRKIGPRSRAARFSAIEAAMARKLKADAKTRPRIPNVMRQKPIKPDDSEDYDGSSPLSNSRHEAFARAVASGRLSNARAYKSVYPDVTQGTSEQAACVLLRNLKVWARYRWLQEQPALFQKLSLQQLQQFAIDGLTTPVGDINEHHYLAQEVTRTTSDHGDTVKIKTVDKLGLANFAAKLQRLGGFANETTVVVEAKSLPAADRAQLLRAIIERRAQP